MRKFADSEVMPQAQGWHRQQQIHPVRRHHPDGGARRVRPHNRGGVRRPGARQGIDVRGLRGIVARLYRGRLARHPLGDCRRADSRQRNRSAEAQVVAADRVGRSLADGGFHRARNRLRSRLAQDPRGPRRRCLSHLRQQDLDHPSGARRPDDAPGANQSERDGLSRSLHVARREAARRRPRTVPGRVA